jgi:two-component system NtrC family sensor kinase
MIEPAGDVAGRDPASVMLRAARRLLWLLVLPVLLLLGVLTVVQYHQRMQDAERDLLRRAQERAQELEAVAGPAMAHVQDLKALLENHWAAPADAGIELRQTLRAREVGGRPDGWSLDETSAEQRERLGQVWWAEPDGREPDRAWLNRAQAFNDAARIVHRRSPGFEATWFAAAEVNTSFGYPWVATGVMLEAMGAPSLLAIDEPRRVAAQRSIDALARDHEDTTFWGSPYPSQLDGQPVLSHGAMVVVDGKYMGEVSLDFRIDGLQARARNWNEPDGRTWIVDTRQLVLADSALPLARGSAAGSGGTAPMRVSLADRLPAGLGRADLDDTLFGPARAHHGEGWVLVAAVRIGSPWIYVQALPESTLRAQILPSLLPNAVLGLALLAMFVAAQWLLARNFVRPALAVLDYLQRLSGDPTQAAPRLGRRWQGWIDAVRDTFARQRAAQRRERQTEALKAAIIDHAINGIVSTDEDGRIVEFNPAAEAMFGQRRADVLGRPVSELIIAEPLRAAQEAGPARGGSGGLQRLVGQRVQVPARRADGSEITVEMAMFRTAFDGTVHFTATLSDITRRLEAEQQVERQRDALRQSEKLTAMGSLLAGVAHELNNPLAIVMGRASLLEEKTEGTPLATDALRIREAAERCGRIVRTFLNMARQKPAERAPVQLNDIARAAAEMLGYTLRSHGIELAMDLAEPLPEALADGDQIGQVVLNLIVNAQQSVAQSDAPRRIGLQTGLEGRRDDREPRVWLRVTDSGPGVPAGLRERIFEPFFTTKTDGMGTGLGLSVSRAMVREHGGDLVLEEGRPDGSRRGAVFRLSLPVGAAVLDAAEAPEPDGEDDVGQARALVVDDEVEIADLIRTMLDVAGYEVATAESGAVALELLDTARFDFIISDLRMPDMDGAELWREVRARAPALAQRMLFVTGDALSTDAQRFLAETGCRSLDKPFTRAALLAAVQAMLQP